MQLPGNRKGPAPIALFVYNRPDHTARTLDALVRNTLAAETDLIVFSDGAKGDADAGAVSAVRALVADIRGFRSVSVRKKERNVGLAKSIIAGVSEVVAEYGRVIVIEDDLVTHHSALSYFNRCLTHFEKHAGVFSISGYSHPARVMPIPQDYKLDVYAIPRMQCWGWATWADRWAQADFSIPEFSKFNSDAAAVAAYRHWIGSDSLNTLRACMRGEKDVWACRWVYTHFKHHAVCICPTRSLIDNIGLDGSGSNCGVSSELSQDVGLQEISDWQLPDQVFVDTRLFESFMTVMEPRRFPKPNGQVQPPIDDVRAPRNIVRRISYWAGRPQQLVRQVAKKGRRLLALQSAGSTKPASPAAELNLAEKHNRISARPQVPLVRVGTDYGGWWVPETGLGSDDVMISAGAGEDISFDIGVARRYGCKVIVMDPTPRAIAHFETTRTAICEGKRAAINNSTAEFYEASSQDIERLIYRPWGLWTESTTLRFHAPKNPTSVSHSISNLQSTVEGFDAVCLSLSDVMVRENIARVTILKIDIEGAEFAVLDKLVASDIRPRFILAEFHPGQSQEERTEKTRTLATLGRLYDVGYRLVAHRGWDYVMELQN